MTNYADLSLDPFAETDYFVDLLMVLAYVRDGEEGGLSNEEYAHLIMDVHTHDGKLDTDALDTYINRLAGV